MIRKDDLAAAIAGGTKSTLERAFCALVGDPSEEVGQDVATADGLEAVCIALEHDDSIMPSSTVDALRGRADLSTEDDALNYGSSYAGGVSIVLDHLEAFEARLQGKAGV